MQTSTTTFGEDLVRTVRKIAGENPDFVYTKPTGAIRCQYVNAPTFGARTPGCLVGQALLRMGAITLDFADNNSNMEGVGDVLAVLGVYDQVTEDEMNWLAKVQEIQDRGIPWGTAVFNADV